MTPHDFIAKWRNGGDERRDAQPFFEDLCRLVGHPTPREADPEHTWFTYEYGASKTSGGEGWADVWKKGFFGWEAKGTHKSLDRAYEQLKMYADALQNPPLLVVSDLQTIVVHTNFTNAVKRVYRFTVEQLADYDTRQILVAVFNHPDTLRPGVTRAAITQEAAEKFTRLAKALGDRGHDPHPVAHFLNRLLFCMFAEDIGLLPAQLFTKLVDSSKDSPALFEKRSRELFAAMNTGGDVAFENVDWFNGGLFEDDATLRLEPYELKLLLEACRLDWSEIDPGIFGTLFERGLDPSKRSQLGAHYTDPETIMKIVRPVVIEPWVAEWEDEKIQLSMLLAKAKKSVSKPAQDRFNQFLERLRTFTVLDPACGSGNFLYLALRALKDIEKRVLIEGETLGLGRQFPGLGPSSVKGIELNTYAAELARITIWIGEIQWMIQNGYGAKKNPILQPLDQIENRDALLNEDRTEAVWPVADVIIGNPPFIGDKKIAGELTVDYANKLRVTYAGRVPGGADFVCYWFEKANDAIKANNVQRAGLVATNSIRGGKNREVLKHIADTARIFEAWSNEDWINEGAAVRVSLVCFGRGIQGAKLDGKSVAEIFSDLTEGGGERGSADLTKASEVVQNRGISFQGVTPSASLVRKRREELGLPEVSFNLDGEAARSMLREPANVRGERMSDVVAPYWVADDITARPLDRFIINFGVRDELSASMFERPFSAIANIRLHRAYANRNREYPWWLLLWPRPVMFKVLRGLKRFIVIPRVSKHHLCAWAPAGVTPGDALIVVARDDDTSIGILQSRIHEIWALRQGSSLEDRPRYTHTTSFETFPFPELLAPNVPAADFADSPRAQPIAAAARALMEARSSWLNPLEWVDWQSTPQEDAAGFPARPVVKPGYGADLKKRTLTNLYNARPPWLDNLHRALDEAVAAAYGWEWPLSDDEVLRRLFVLNQARAAHKELRS